MFVAPLVPPNTSADNSFFIGKMRRGGLITESPVTNARLQTLGKLFSVFPLGDAGLENGQIGESLARVFHDSNGNIMPPELITIPNCVAYPSQDTVHSLSRGLVADDYAYQNYIRRVATNLLNPDFFKALQAGDTPEDIATHVAETSVDYTPIKTDIHLILPTTAKSLFRGSPSYSATDIAETLKQRFKANGIFSSQPSRQELVEAFELRSQMAFGYPPLTPCLFAPKSNDTFSPNLGDVTGWAILNAEGFREGLIIRDRALAIKTWKATRGTLSLAAI